MIIGGVKVDEIFEITFVDGTKMANDLWNGYRMDSKYVKFYTVFHVDRKRRVGIFKRREIVVEEKEEMVLLVVLVDKVKCIERKLIKMEK